jgi:hypothetical protein
MRQEQARQQHLLLEKVYHKTKQILMVIIHMEMLPMEMLPKEKLLQWEVTTQMPLDCMICTGMCGNGVMIGMGNIQIQQ